MYPLAKGDPLCPLGFHPQVRWPTRCKRCFRDYKEHGGKRRDEDSSLRRDDTTASTPSLSWNSRYTTRSFLLSTIYRLLIFQFSDNGTFNSIFFFQKNDLRCYLFFFFVDTPRFETMGTHETPKNNRNNNQNLWLKLVLLFKFFLSYSY
jgi:hypothetical protein